MFREVFDKISNPQNYILIDENHPLELYGGYDEKGRKSILIVTSIETNKIQGSEYLDVSIIDDEPKRIIISLKDFNYDEQFMILIDDIIEYSSKTTSDIISARRIIQRFYMWKQFFDNKNKLMSFEQIKGLYAELLFLKDFMLVNYNEFITISSWLGPEKSKRDFELSNYWYEVKSITSDSNEVLISSVKQLDDPIIGDLVLVKLERSNFSDPTTMSLYDLVEAVLDRIIDLEQKEKFIGKLNQYGYKISEEYKKFKFHFLGFNHITISPSSNIIREKDVPLSVSSIKYKLNYKMINNKG
jgi:hypothetical protein